MTENRRARVLAIDDDRVATDVIVKALLARGVDVSVVASPDRGIEKAAADKPDLIFVSLFFPDSNGLKLSKRIHAVEGLEKVPVVMLISYKGELDAKYTSTIGIVDVLVKPLKSEDVVEKAIKVLGKDVLAEEMPPEAPAEEVSAALPSQDEPASDDARAQVSLRQEARDPQPEVWPDENPVDTEAGGRSGHDETAEFLNEESGEEAPAPAVKTPLDEETTQRPSEEAGPDSAMPFSFDDEITPADEPRKFFSGRRIAVIAAVCAALVLGIGAYGLKKVLSKEGRTAQSRQELPAKEVVTEPAVGAVVPEDGAVKPAVKGPEKKTKGAGEGVEERRKEVSPEEKGGAVSPAPQKRPKDTGKQAVVAAVRRDYGYSVQLGAFGSEKNAASLVEKLKKRGYDAFIEDSGGGRTWRVLVGKFANAKQASVKAKALREDGFKTLLRRGGD